MQPHTLMKPRQQPQLTAALPKICAAIASSRKGYETLHAIAQQGISRNVQGLHVCSCMLFPQMLVQADTYCLCAASVEQLHKSCAHKFRQKQTPRPKSLYKTYSALSLFVIHFIDVVSHAITVRSNQRTNDSEGIRRHRRTAVYQRPTVSHRKTKWINHDRPQAYLALCALPSSSDWTSKGAKGVNNTHAGTSWSAPITRRPEPNMHVAWPANSMQRSETFSRLNYVKQNSASESMTVADLTCRERLHCDHESVACRSCCFET